jgi:valyl-tRNA synthetase
LWNAARFAVTNLSVASDSGAKAHPVHGVGFGADSVNDLSLVDKWILARLHRTLHKIEDALAEYQFNIYAEAMYDFIWRDFCDWYLEAIKPTVKSNPAQQQVLRTVLNAALRLLHPICPFITEALYPSVAACGVAGLKHCNLQPSNLLATAPWPDIACAIDDKQAHDQFVRIQSLVESIRTLRGEHRVPDRKRITLHASSTALDIIKSSQGVVESLGEELLLLGLVEEVDPAVERERLATETEKLAKAIENLQGRLANPGYVQKAPPAKVQETRDLLEQTARELELKRERLASLAR